MFGGLFGGFGSPATTSNTGGIGTPGGFSLGEETNAETTASRWGSTLGTPGTASTGTRGCGGFLFDGGNGTYGEFRFGGVTTAETSAPRSSFTLGTQRAASTGNRGCGVFSFVGGTDTFGGFPFGRVTTAETSAPKSTFTLGTQRAGSTGTRGCGGFSSVGCTDTPGVFPFGGVTTAETKAPISSFVLGTKEAASTGSRGGCGFSLGGCTDTTGVFPFGGVTTAETKAPISSFVLGTKEAASTGSRGGCGFSLGGCTDTTGVFPFGGVTTAETKAPISSFVLGTKEAASTGSRGGCGFSLGGGTDTYGGCPFGIDKTAETTAPRSGFTLGTPGTASTGTRGGGGLLFNRSTCTSGGFLFGKETTDSTPASSDGFTFGIPGAASIGTGDLKRKHSQVTTIPHPVITGTVKLTKEPQKSASKSLENYFNTVKEERSSLVFRSSQIEPQTSVTDSFVDAHGNLNNSISMTTMSPEMQSIVAQIQQLQDDEEIARVLQEEMDSEFATSLQGRMGTGHHSAIGNPSRVEPVKTTQHQSGTMGHQYNVLSHGNHGTSISKTTMSSVTHSACTQIQQLQDDEEVPSVLQEEIDRDSVLNVQGSIGASLSGAIGHTGAMSSPSRVEPVSAVKHQPNRRRRRRRRHNETNQEPIRNYEHGLKSQEVDELSVIPCKKQNTESDAVEECNICMDIYEEGHQKRYLPCCHYFHVSCIDKWLMKKPSCPVCRVDIHANVNTPALLL